MELSKRNSEKRKFWVERSTSAKVGVRDEPGMFKKHKVFLHG